MRKTIIQAAIILGIALIGATLSAFFHPKRPAWYAVTSHDAWTFTPDVLREKLGADLESVLWVDARKVAAFEKEHMEGAINLSTENWQNLIAKNITQLQGAMGKPVVVYCDGSRCKRSGEIAQRLRELVRLEPVYVLKGSWREWLK